MKLPILLIVSLAAVLRAATNYNNMKICPAMNNFDAAFPSIADVVLPESEPFFYRTAWNFFHSVMKFNDIEVSQLTKDAITFFNVTYGIDFSSVPVSKNGSRYLAEFDATLFDFEMNPAIHYSVTINEWAVNGVRQSYCVDTRDGGFVVMFRSDATLHGTYGGEKGIPIRANERIIYGFYNIPLCSQSPLIIQYQSATPIRIEKVDGFAIINLDLFSRELGHGLAQGVFRVTPLGDGNIHYVIRNLLTFPPHPSWKEGGHCTNDKDNTLYYNH